MTGPYRLTVTQQARIEGARALLAAAPEDLAAPGVIDPEDRAMVHGYAFGAARSAVASLLDIIGALTVSVPGSGVTLSPAQLAVVLDALADAETHREREGLVRCGDCEQDGICADHGADFDAAQAYHDLTAELTGGTS